MWTGYISLSIGTSGGGLVNTVMNFRFHKKRGTS
jgi:hypothetical protein